MLIQFRIKNFKSFKDENILFMTATDVHDITQRYFRKGQYKLLPLAGIFGANASGKSNILEAIRYMHNHIMFSNNYDENQSEDIYNEKNRFDLIQKNTQIPFLFDEETKDKDSLFELTYIDSNNITYQYGFTINKNTITDEWLERKTKTGTKFKIIFNRKNSDYKGISDIIDKEKINSSINSHSLILSTGAKLNIEPLKSVYNWFSRNKFINFGEPFENLFLSKLTENLINENHKKIKSLINYVNNFDPSITDFEIDTNTKSIFVVHNNINSDIKTKLPYFMESDGTKKMISMFFQLEDTMKSNNILFVDELNAKLHPLLVRFILMLFYNKEQNPNCSQLIFSSHDPWMLDNDSLRKDEIWFTEKDENGVSTLYSLDEFKLSDSPNIDIEEYYLLGGFGAIPQLKPIYFKDNENE